jgi:hypothetical protein
MPMPSNFHPVYPFVIDCTAMNAHITRKEMFMFADDLCDTLDEMYGDIFVGASGNVQEKSVVAYFTKLMAAKEFAGMWAKGQKKVMEDNLRRRFPDDEDDLPF